MKKEQLILLENELTKAEKLQKIKKKWKQQIRKA
ncbi:putative conjugal transfer protein TrbE part [Dirofilaria immitis]